jgi:membrane protease YdiL (CAAX protease family)
MRKENKIKGWQRILSIIIPYLLIVGIFQLIGGMISGVDFNNLNFQKSSEQTLIISFFSLLGTTLVVCIFMKYIDKENFIGLGFHTKNRLNEFYLGFLIGAIIIISGFVLLQFLDEIKFQKTLFNFKEFIYSILLFLAVSITEEVLSRGYILRNLMLSFNKYFALILSSSLFSLMHGFNPNIDLFGLVSIFTAGIFLGITYIHTKNLWFPIALHFSWNFFQTVLGFNVSGKDIYSVVEFSMKEKTLLNGGTFGFEGSIFSIIAMIVTIVIISIYYQRKKLSTTSVANK